MSENGVSNAMPVHAGFIPLVDSAPLIVAREKGFAEQEHIELKLTKETSWANIRDRLTLRHFDCAQVLAGIPVASGLGLGNMPARLIAPMSLGLNGNAITVSCNLFNRMKDAGLSDGVVDIRSSGVALARIVAAGREAGEEPLTFGMVHPFSCHNYELRYWLAAFGIHPDRDVRLVVVPPPYVVDYLNYGYVDGFCVGEPWNGLAVSRGLGRVVATKSDLWRRGPEKVLGMRADWASENEERVHAVIRALHHAAAWCDQTENRDELAALLARTDYVGAPVDVIRRALRGDITGQGPGGVDDDFILFSRNAATFPWTSHASWIYSQMVRWGQVEASGSARQLAIETYRPDIFRRAVAGHGIDVPGASAKVEGAFPQAEPVGSTGGKLLLGPDQFFDGRVFDPDLIDAYIASFEIHSIGADRTKTASE